MAPMLHVALPKLRHFDMSYNRIGSVARLMGDLLFLVDLEYWDVSHQDKRYDGDSGIYTNEQQGIYPQSKKYENRNAKVRKSTSEVCKIQRFQPCKYTSYGYLPPRGSWCIPLPPKLEVLNLSQSLNAERHTLPAVVVLTSGRLKIVEYRRNAIRIINNPVI